MHIMNGIKLVTFDATNTLLKFRIPPWEYYASVAQKYGYTGTGDNLKKKLRKNYSQMTKEYPNFGKNNISWYEWWRRVVHMTLHDELPKSVNVNDIAETLIQEFKTSKCWSKADGSDNIINFLHESGITIGVISNFDPRLHEILKNINIYDNFQFVLTSFEIGVCKPDKKIFEYAINKCSKILRPEECLHIGDDISNDYKGAKAAGWHSLLVADNINVEDDVDPKDIFKNLQKLHKALLK